MERKKRNEFFLTFFPLIYITYKSIVCYYWFRESESNGKGKEAKRRNEEKRKKRIKKGRKRRKKKRDFVSEK